MPRLLRWTPAGAVPFPTTVQIRVEPRFPDRLEASAPTPTRALSSDELRSNLHHFTVDLDGPRTRPCTAVVLSGHGVDRRADVPEAIAEARSNGVRWVVLHGGSTDPGSPHLAWMPGQVNRLVVPVRSLEDALRTAELTRSVASKLGVVAAIDLQKGIVDHLPAVVAALAAEGPAELVVTWPFPTAHGPAARAPLPGTWRAPLSAAVAEAARHDRRLLVRGLPACHLNGLDVHQRRTTNRWYVDAAHQAADALLFLPDVVTFAKGDPCRFCAADPRCDGFFAAYLEAGHPRLEPVAPLP